MKLKHDVAVWENKAEGGLYAFPLGPVNDRWGVAYPLLKDNAWDYQGTLPKGMEVTEVEQVNGNKVKCRLAGHMVYTADWGIESA